LITIVEPDWILQPKISRKERAQNTKNRKKHYTFIEDLRTQTIANYFSNHIDHGFIATESRYEDDILQCIFIYCGCEGFFKITQDMIKEFNNGEEFKHL
jgi:hypothetical protein